MAIWFGFVQAAQKSGENQPKVESGINIGLSMTLSFSVQFGAMKTSSESEIGLEDKNV